MTEYAMQQQMEPMTVEYLKKALFEEGVFELKAGESFNDEGLNWNDEETLKLSRRFQPNEGWYWEGEIAAEGVLWGGCVESLDDILRCNQEIPSLELFKEVVLMTETSEELPESGYVGRVFRALGERGVLSRIKGVLVGRPKAWEFDKRKTDEEKIAYKKAQREAIIKTVRKYNSTIPIVFNLDFGHTSPQIPMPLGRKVRIDPSSQKIIVEF